MKRRTLLAGAWLLGALLMGNAPAALAVAADATITIDNFTFTPAQVTVAAGTKVTWMNRDDIPHTITDAGTPRSFKSAPLDTGDSFSFVYSSPGTYHYFCSLHPHMQGTIIVQ